MVTQKIELSEKQMKTTYSFEDGCFFGKIEPRSRVEVIEYSAQDIINELEDAR